MTDEVRAAPATDPAIVTQGLSKSFGTAAAVQAVDWTVDRGSIHGLVGPNGAGKTTMLKMLLGTTRPGAGSGTVMGSDIGTGSGAIRARTAFVPEDKLVFERYRVSEFVSLYRRPFPDWEAALADRMLAAWEIPERRRVRDLSKGMRAKLLLTVALARRPRLLLMDEPTLDLDPASVDEIYALLAEWVADGEHTIVISTHRLEEVERMCDSVSIMTGGRIVEGGDLDDLRERWKQLDVVGPLPDDIERRPGVEAVRRDRHVATIVVSRGAGELADALHSDGRQVDIIPVNLRRIYLTAIRHEKGSLDGVLQSLA